MISEKAIAKACRKVDVLLASFLFNHDVTFDTWMKLASYRGILRRKDLVHAQCLFINSCRFQSELSLVQD